MRPYLELIRVYLIPTALADSWAGFFIGRHLASIASPEASPLDPVSIGELTLLGLLSAAAYAFGMLTNDLFDVQKDTDSATRRPLVTGEATTKTACLLAVSLILTVLVLCNLLHVFALGLTLLATILAYNAGGKRIPLLGDLLMGSCRGLNLLLGVAVAFPFALDNLIDDAIPAIPAGLLALYISVVTGISRLEDRPYDRVTLCSWMVVLPGFAVFLAFFPGSNVGTWINGAIFVFWLLPGLKMPRPEELARSSPHPASGLVRRALGAIYFVDAGLLWSFGLGAAAGGVYVLFVLGWILRRLWIKSDQ